MKTKKKKLTEKEAEIMQRLWNKGPQTVRELIEDMPEPKPHFSTVSTVIRVLTDKGFVEHVGLRKGAYTYGAIVESEEMGEGRLANLVKNYFNNSYLKVVSALVKEEKISVQELKELIEMVENESKEK